MNLLTELGFNTYRSSVEWSRIEPEDGEFSAAALDHYARVAAACRDPGLEPMVILHHFTTPRWVAGRGGWTTMETAMLFERYVERVMDAFGGQLTLVCTLNEPNVVATNGYLLGLFPPGERDPARRAVANETLIDAHRRAAEVVQSGEPKRD